MRPLIAVAGRCALLAGQAWLLAACGTPAAQNPAASVASPQGDSWASIKQLPDWSGTWTYSMTDTLALKVPEGVLLDEKNVPMQPDYAERRAKAVAAHAQNSLSTCLPAGIPGVMLHGTLDEFLFTPGRVTMLVEDGEVRRIYTDGRPHVKLSDLRESYMGDSIGHWEGQTLVVDTIGFPKGTLFQNAGGEVTINTHLVERFTKVDADHIRVDSTMTDPAIFTKPYVFTRLYKRAPAGLAIGEPVCQQNNRDTGTTMDLTPPPED
ncbi:MAG TPA: hypothetical protein VMI92_01190 [Steroidobacteraceae bacterium]|nr:hypothetical protein [Steroidobacteraceae bacterium]